MLRYQVELTVKVMTVNGSQYDNVQRSDESNIVEIDKAEQVTKSPGIKMKLIR